MLATNVDEDEDISPSSLEILLWENLMVDNAGLVSKRCCSTFEKTQLFMVLDNFFIVG